VINDIDPFGEPRDGFINRIIDHFLGQMVRSGGIGIHAGPAPDRIKPLQYFQRGRIVIHAGGVFKQAVIFNSKPPNPNEPELKIEY
jgi:hypothetical protein